MKLLCAPQYTEHQFNFTRNEKKISGIECHVEFWFSRWRQKLFLGHFSEDLWTFDLVGGDLNICFLAENKCSSHGVGKRNRQECRQQNHINHCRDNTRFKTCVICLWLASFSVEGGCKPQMYILTPRKQNSSSTHFIFCLWSVISSVLQISEEYQLFAFTTDQQTIRRNFSDWRSSTFTSGLLVKCTSRLRCSLIIRMIKMIIGDWWSWWSLIKMIIDELVIDDQDDWWLLMITMIMTIEAKLLIARSEDQLIATVGPQENATGRHCSQIY